jgi:hypothetical protein
VPKHTKDWWEAQTRLYGLKPAKYTIGEMKKVFTKAIKEDTLVVSMEVQQIKDALVQKWEGLWPQPEKPVLLAKWSKPGLEVQKPVETEEQIKARNEKMKIWEEERRVKRDREFQRISEEQLEEMNSFHDCVVQCGPGDTPTGTWQMYCPEIIKGHLCTGEDYNLYREKFSKIEFRFNRKATEENCLWGFFGFVLYDGFFRLDWDEKWSGDE